MPEARRVSPGMNIENMFTIVEINHIKLIVLYFKKNCIYNAEAKLATRIYLLDNELSSYLLSTQFRSFTETSRHTPAICGTSRAKLLPPTGQCLERV